MKPSEAIFGLTGIILWFGGNVAWGATLVRDFFRWKDWRPMWVAIGLQVIINLVVIGVILDSIGK